MPGYISNRRNVVAKLQPTKIYFHVPIVCLVSSEEPTRNQRRTSEEPATTLWSETLSFEAFCRAAIVKPDRYILILSQIICAVRPFFNCLSNDVSLFVVCARRTYIFRNLLLIHGNKRGRRGRFERFYTNMVVRIRICGGKSGIGGKPGTRRSCNENWQCATRREFRRFHRRFHNYDNLWTTTSGSRSVQTIFNNIQCHVGVIKFSEIHDQLIRVQIKCNDFENWKICCTLNQETRRESDTSDTKRYLIRENRN